METLKNMQKGVEAALQSALDHMEDFRADENIEDIFTRTRKLLRRVKNLVIPEPTAQETANSIRTAKKIISMRRKNG